MTAGTPTITSYTTKRDLTHRRPHTALDGLTPMAALVNNVHGKHN
jgi:hypothetical protein